MLKEKISKLLVEQVNKEFFSAYLYLSFANFYEEAGLDGFANWYRIQAMEERDHAIMFMDYVHDNDGPIQFEAIGKPDSKLKNLIDPLKAALQHEKYITASINAIYDEAAQSKDYRTMQFLDWFVMEQREEEKTASDLVTKFELFGSDAKNLYSLNEELKTRVYTAPANNN